MVYYIESSVTQFRYTGDFAASGSIIAEAVFIPLNIYIGYV